MIDAGHQRAGIGRRAVDLLVGELRAAGWSALETARAGRGRGGQVLEPLLVPHHRRERHGESVVERAL